MRKIATTVIIVSALLLSTANILGSFDLALANPINMLPDLPSIYIRSDGSIEPTSGVPIQRDGDTYRLTDNIADRKIMVQRNDTVIDGNGFALRQTPVDMNQPGAGTIDQGWHCAVDLDGRNNVTIRNLMFDSCIQGIEFRDASNINISNNRFLGSSVAGVLFVTSLNVTVEKNTFLNNVGGIRFALSSYHIVGNAFKNNSYGIGLLGGNFSGNSIVGNVINNGSFGIMMEVASYEHVEANNITNHQFGIYLTRASNCTFYRNNLIDNTYNVFAGVYFNGTYLNHDLPSAPPGSQSLSQPNFWSENGKGNYYNDYNGTDANHDGVGDTPYVMDENNQDNYPLICQASTEPPYTITPFAYSSSPSITSNPSLNPTPPSSPSS